MRLANVGARVIDDMRFIMGNGKCSTLYILRLENRKRRKTYGDWANKEKEEIGKKFRNIFKSEMSLPI